MDIILRVALVACVLLLALLVAAWFLVRKTSRETRRLAERVGHLPLRAKLALGFELMRDERIPLPLRCVPLLLILYLAMPLDLIPDFIPVAGQLDDVLVLVVGAGLLLRFTPVHVLEQRIGELETAYASGRQT